MNLITVGMRSLLTLFERAGDSAERGTVTDQSRPTRLALASMGRFIAYCRFTEVLFQL